MEIIKHGNTKDKEPYRLTCYNCGCEFIADWSETYTIATPIVLVAQGHKLGKWRYCDCPDCKSMIMIEEVDINGNSLNNVSEKTKEDDEIGGLSGTKIPEYAETYDNGIIGCPSISKCPAIPDDVLEKNKVTPKELMEAYNDIERRRYEDNLPWWKKLFRKLFLFAFVALTAVQICSCTHTLEDTDGIITCVEYQKTKEYTYKVVIKYLDRYGPNNQVNFLTNTLYHVGDTIRLGRPCCEHVVNETDTMKN